MTDGRKYKVIFKGLCLKELQILLKWATDQNIDSFENIVVRTELGRNER